MKWYRWKLGRLAKGVGFTSYRIRTRDAQGLWAGIGWGLYIRVDNTPYKDPVTETPKKPQTELNVVPLTPKPKGSASALQMAKELEGIAKRMRNGELQGLALALVDPKEITTMYYCEDNRFGLLGAVSQLSYRISVSIQVNK